MMFLGIIVGLGCFSLGYLYGRTVEMNWHHEWFMKYMKNHSLDGKAM